MAQHEGALACAQAGHSPSQGQAACSVFKANGQIGGDHAIDQSARGEQLEVALHMAQSGHIDAAVADQEFLACAAVFKQQQGAAAGARGHADSHRFAHGIDTQLRTR